MFEVFLFLYRSNKNTNLWFRNNRYAIVCHLVALVNSCILSPLHYCVTELFLMISVHFQPEIALALAVFFFAGITFDLFINNHGSIGTIGGCLLATIATVARILLYRRLFSLYSCINIEINFINKESLFTGLSLVYFNIATGGQCLYGTTAHVVYPAFIAMTLTGSPCWPTAAMVPSARPVSKAVLPGARYRHGQVHVGRDGFFTRQRQARWAALSCYTSLTPTYDDNVSPQLRTDYYN